MALPQSVVPLAGWCKYGVYVTFPNGDTTLSWCDENGRVGLDQDYPAGTTFTLVQPRPIVEC